MFLHEKYLLRFIIGVYDREIFVTISKILF